MAEALDVKGTLAKLGDGRLVYVGRCADKPATSFIAFRNAEGVDTNFQLSDEARDVLLMLLSQPVGSERFPFKREWRVVTDHKP